MTTLHRDTKNVWESGQPMMFYCKEIPLQCAWKRNNCARLRTSLTEKYTKFIILIDRKQLLLPMPPKPITDIGKYEYKRSSYVAL